MKFTKEYIEQRLLNSSVQDLAEELEKATHVPNSNVQATIDKYKDMLRPLAPAKEVTTTELFESMGINVVRVS